jgi:DNA-directed RNA polymerase subunit K/omega
MDDDFDEPIQIEDDVGFEEEDVVDVAGGGENEEQRDGEADEVDEVLDPESVDEIIENASEAPSEPSNVRPILSRTKPQTIRTTRAEAPANSLEISNAIRTHIIVHPDERVTDNKIQKTELAFVVASRAKQITSGAQAFANCENVIDPIERVYRELREKKNPMRIRRLVGIRDERTYIYEEWNVREMALPEF